MEVRGNLGPGTVSLHANPKYEVQDLKWGGRRREGYQVHGETLAVVNTIREGEKLEYDGGKKGGHDDIDDGEGMKQKTDFL